MLGVKVKRTLVNGEFAKDIRKQVERIQRGRLSDCDKKAINKNRQITSEINVIWK